MFEMRLLHKLYRWFVLLRSNAKKGADGSTTYILLLLLLFGVVQKVCKQSTYFENIRMRLHELVLQMLMGRLWHSIYARWWAGRKGREHMDDITSICLM